MAAEQKIKEMNSFLFAAVCLLGIAQNFGLATEVPSVPISAGQSTSGSASFTYYDSYPMCCPDSPNYDPSYPTEECDDYSGCKYMGDLAAFQSESNPDGHVSLEYVMTHNLIAFYDDSDRTGKNWASHYANKTVQVTKEYNGKTYSFNCSIADTCGNRDCSNCCSRNSKPSGYLVDMEYYTVLRNFGTLDAVEGSLPFIVF